MTEVGIVGLPQAGKSTLMSAVTGAQAAGGDVLRGVIPVPDERVDRLAEIFQPKKTTYATLQITDLAPAHGPLKKGEMFTPAQLGHLRDMDLLIVLVRVFGSEAVPHPLNRIAPPEDFSLFLSECLLADLAIVEKRVERLDTDISKGGAGKKVSDLELEKDGLVRIQAALAEEKPARSVEVSDQQEIMYRGFGFLSGKQIIPVANTSDLGNDAEKKGFESLKGEVEKTNTAFPAWNLPDPFPVNAALELELREMLGPENLGGEEASEYFQEVGLGGPCYDAIITQAYKSLGLISFLTTGEDEVRAWTIPQGYLAPNAAGAIHSDLERGFIRADTVAYDDFIKAGNMADCRKAGTLRTEGKEYVVADGDIIEVKFSV